MERLTKRCKQALNDEMTKFKKFIEIALSEPKYHEKGNFSTQSTYDIYETNKLYPMASKLADYEDAEEQGLLLRLPCKIGDFLYTLESIYIIPIRLNDVIVSFAGLNNYVYQYNCCSFDECGDVFEEYEFDDDDFGKLVFLTREEAEKALADMGV